MVRRILSHSRNRGTWFRRILCAVFVYLKLYFPFLFTFLFTFLSLFFLILNTKSLDTYTTYFQNCFCFSITRVRWASIITRQFFYLFIIRIVHFRSIFLSNIRGCFSPFIFDLKFGVLRSFVTKYPKFGVFPVLRTIAF